MVEHAGLNPAENASATFRDQTQLSRRDTPLRWLHAIVTRRWPFHPDIATGLLHATSRHTQAVAA
ncbi:hypothetical protein [Dactylosporangium sp. CA-233914]|uniref:hypothetical protein n=1 Tax=Dactylosporangium sp. CA-233914 TaxID=3239934 RepID=UPI003D8F72D4